MGEKVGTVHIVFNTVKEFFNMFFSMICGIKSKVDEINNETIERVKKNKGDLTILLHGVAANYYRTMYSQIVYFQNRGIDIVSVGYDFHLPVEVAAVNVKKRITKIMKKTVVKKFNLIGISLGGLVARYYAEVLGGRRVIDKLVTVYAPIKPTKTGTMSAKLHNLVGGNVEHSNIILELMRNSFHVKKHLAIYGKHDGMIGRQYPIGGEHGKSVKQVGVYGGHIFVSFNEDAMKLAGDYLKGKDF